MENRINLEKNHFIFLYTIYQAVEGNEDIRLNLLTLQKLLEKHVWSEHKIKSLVNTLAEVGLIYVRDFGNSISITLKGIDEVRNALANPDLPTNNFPAISTLNLEDLIPCDRKEFSENKGTVNRSKYLICLSFVVGILIVALILGFGEGTFLPLMPASTPTATDISLPTVTPTIPDIFTGDLLMNYPIELTVDRGDVVSVVVKPKAETASIEPIPVFGIAAVSIENSKDFGEREVMEVPIRLYPIMSAELSSAKDIVDITGAKDNVRYLALDNIATWTWDIVAHKAGHQMITLRIFGEVLVEEEKITILEKSISRTIDVSNKPLIERVVDVLIDNLIVILGTSGPLGVIIAYLTLKYSHEKKSIETRVDYLEQELGIKK